MSTLGVPNFQATPCAVDSSFMLKERPLSLTLIKSVNCSTEVVDVLSLDPA